MKTILVPFDSSKTSNNTIDYVCGLLKQIKAEKVFILQSLELNIFGGIVNDNSTDDTFDQRNSIELALKEITERVQKCAGPDTVVKYAISEFPLLRSVHQAINELEPDVIIAGSDSDEDTSLIGDEIITLSKSSPVPVLVVPSGCKYVTIRNALVPCNFNDLSSLTLLDGLKTIETQEKVKLELLNIYSDENQLNNKEEVELRIADLLVDYDYHFNYSESANVVDGILDFADINHVQVIIALPGKHSFFYRLTHSSITQALTQNSSKPVLLLKETEE